LSEDCFAVSHQEGRTGELYAQKHLNELITGTASDITDTSAEKIEGKDFVATISGEDVFVEVKTVRGFLFRTNDNQEESGTIGFELWKSSKRTTSGWLPQMLNPDGIKSVQPGILIFLLVEYDRPLACVTFENVPALFERLKDLTGKMGFDLNNVPFSDEANAFTIPSGLLVKNMWLVPLIELKDLARITMIGEQPRLRPTIEASGRMCQHETQLSRYEMLVALAKKNSVSHDDEYAFTGNKAIQTITVAAKNLDVLDRLNWNHYEQLQYMNRTGMFERLWEGLYRFMLSREIPSRARSGKMFYPISYRTITTWGYKNGIECQPDAWFNCIKHLLEFELLEHFQPNKYSTNPIDLAVNKNNSHPRSVEYYSPIELTDDVLLDADYYAQDYKRNKRRTSTTSRASIEIQSGKEASKRSYEGNRKLTKQDDYVWKLALTMLDEEIGQHNYIEVSRFFAKLWRRIVHNQKLKLIENVTTPEDEKEQTRYEKFYCAYNQLKREKKELIDQSWIYKIGLVTKKDRRWLGKLPYGTYIITYKDRPDCFDKQYYSMLEKERASENAKRRKKRKEKNQKGKETSGQQ